MAGFGTLTRRFPPHLKADLIARVSRQSSGRGTGGASSDFDSWIVRLNFTYSLDAIRVWR